MRLRPGTPLIKLDKKINEENSKEIKNTNDSILKNFSNFMKEIIENKNESSFLSGDKNIIKYVLSKYLNIPEENLNSLKKLSIIITNDYGLLNQFGTFLPELKLLKLNNSNILSFNDIGTNFNNIQCLQMKNCHLKNINGIICMQNLEILDIEDNEVSDLLDIDMCSKLTKIVLKKNKISDGDNLTFLSSISNLEYVDIRNNPICEDNNNIENTLIDVKIVLWNDSHNILFQDVVRQFDDNLYELNNKKQQNKIDNKIEKEIDNLLKMNNIKNNESSVRIGGNHNLNPLIRKTKIQIDIIDKPNLSLVNKEKENCNKNKQDNNFTDKINNNKNNINAFRSTLLKKQTLKPIKQNNGSDFLIDRTHYSNGSSTSGGTHSSKENTCYPFKLIVKDDNKEIRSLSNNKIKIKPIKK